MAQGGKLYKGKDKKKQETYRKQIKKSQKKVGAPLRHAFDKKTRNNPMEPLQKEMTAEITKRIETEMAGRVKKNMGHLAVVRGDAADAGELGKKSRT